MGRTPDLSLVAPVDGIVVPLEDLPDPVFSQKMMGDGISIDPTGQVLVAPCAGTIIQLHRAKHALTLRTDSGVSILLHIGLDTVSLNGKGFRALVKEGDRVERKQPLIEFDLDVIAQNATSALTELVVTEGADDLSFKRLEGLVTAGSHEVVRLGAAAPAEEITEAKGEVIRTEHITILNPNGFHARPAAQVAHQAKQFRARVTVHKGPLTAQATSVSDLMVLDLAKGDQIWLSAQGPDASAALAAVRGLIEQGAGEDVSQAPAEVAASERRFVSQDPTIVGGVAASPGLAIGTVTIDTLATPAFEAKSPNSAAELAKLEQSILAVKTTLAADKSKFERAGEVEKAQIFAAHAEILDDSAFEREAAAAISGGASAAAAWQTVVDAKAEKLRSLKSTLMRQRADDLKDIGRRVLFKILGRTPPVQAYSKGTILVSRELTPSSVAHLDATKIGALVTELGGATSHAAIIARSMGVPYVAGVGEGIKKLGASVKVIVDGDQGFVRVAPDAETTAVAERDIVSRRSQRQVRLAEAHRTAKTQDGRTVEVGANIGNAKEAEEAVRLGGDGVGLLRSEFLFMNRRVAPDEDEQRGELEKIARALGTSRSLVVRTLDVGGDKPLSYVPMPAEDNPFLGVRGIRLSLRNPDLFITQIRAVLSATAFTKVQIMFPMIAKLEEFKAAKDIVLREAKNLLVDPKNFKLGVMIEVPSAALMADVLAKEVDFFSLGTNDLTQYTLAMDRDHPELAAEADQLEPAVLRLIQMTVQSAHPAGKPVGICGGIAAETLATPLLVGLDLDELSVPAPAVADVKARIRELNHQKCRALAKDALRANNAKAVRALLKDFK
jgi:phosphoenolpyruvate-protein phosphotransferase